MGLLLVWSRQLPVVELFMVYLVGDVLKRLHVCCIELGAGPRSRVIVLSMDNWRILRRRQHGRICSLFTFDWLSAELLPWSGRPSSASPFFYQKLVPETVFQKWPYLHAFTLNLQTRPPRATGCKLVVVRKVIRGHFGSYLSQKSLPLDNSCTAKLGEFSTRGH